MIKIVKFVLEVVALHYLTLMRETDAKGDDAPTPLVFSVPGTFSGLNNSEDDNESNLCSRLESGKLIK